jgi:hypothetical protein
VSVDPRDLSPEQRRELGIDEEGRSLNDVADDPGRADEARLRLEAELARAKVEQLEAINTAPAHEWEPLVAGAESAGGYLVPEGYVHTLLHAMRSPFELGDFRGWSARRRFAPLIRRPRSRDWLVKVGIARPRFDVRWRGR